jgi:hypothetical protein
MYVTVVHPQIELKLSDARSVLKQNVSSKALLYKWGNVGVDRWFVYQRLRINWPITSMTKS